MKMKTTKRPEPTIFSVRLTETEAEIIRLGIARSGGNVSAYVRAALLAAAGWKIEYEGKKESCAKITRPKVQK